jgi:hypothetical protein
MADNYFGNYGVESGYNQTAPGRDMEEPRAVGRPGRPRRGPRVVGSAIGTPEAPLPEVAPFAGAQQTIAPSRSGRENQLNQNVIDDVARTVRPMQAPSLAPGAPAPGSMANPMAAPQEAPAAYTAKGPAMGLEGFDAGKLAGGHVSPKYVFAKHAQGLGVNDREELLRRLQADESGYFKNASWGGNKGDILTIGGELDPKFEGISQFDVIRAMGEGGKGWQWGDASGGGGGGRATAPGVPAGFVPPQTFLDPSVMQNAIMQSGVPGGQDYSERIKQQILQALQGRL